MAKIKTKRNEEIVNLKLSHPCLSVTVVAEKYGITQQRVSEIWRFNGVHAQEIKKDYYFCNYCGERFHPKATNSRNLYCNNHCRKLANQITFVCEECGQTFSVRQSTVKYRLTKGLGVPRFCSRGCLGANIGRNYGWGEQKEIGPLEVVSP